MCGTSSRLCSDEKHTIKQANSITLPQNITRTTKMHFYSVSLLSLLPLTMGLQTIYLGYVENSAQYVSRYMSSPPSHNHPPSALVLPAHSPPNPSIWPHRYSECWPLAHPIRDAYIAWFSDSSDVCEQGTVFGDHSGGDFTYCDQDLTLLDHPNITFTGCDPSSLTSLPTGVSDEGNPALICAPATTPPGGFPCAANGGAGVIEVLEYCK